MGCCGKSVPRNKPVDKRGNSLNKYAYLHPNQKKILEAEEPVGGEVGDEPK